MRVRSLTSCETSTHLFENKSFLPSSLSTDKTIYFEIMLVYRRKVASKVRIVKLITQPSEDWSCNFISAEIKILWKTEKLPSPHDVD